MNREMYGMNYKLPEVLLLQESGIGSSEYAGRTAYNSFGSSENGAVKDLNFLVNENIEPEHVITTAIDDLNNIDSSELLDKLAWVHHHHSVIEHCNLTFLVKGTSRGVLQEHARHRIQSITVQSTRYTMSKVINAFVVEKMFNISNIEPSDWFISTLLALDLFVTIDNKYNILQVIDIFKKLNMQYNKVGKEEFLVLATSKEANNWLHNDIESLDKSEIFAMLNTLKSKRNVGDAFKHIVNDNWKVDLVFTMNLRAFKNYLDLRNSGAAYFQIQWLAEKLIEATPIKYRKLILKKFRKTNKE